MMVSYLYKERGFSYYFLYVWRIYLILVVYVACLLCSEKHSYDPELLAGSIMSIQSGCIQWITRSFSYLYLGSIPAPLVEFSFRSILCWFQPLQNVCWAVELDLVDIIENHNKCNPRCNPNSHMYFLYFLNRWGMKTKSKKSWETDHKSWSFHRHPKDTLGVC